MRCVMVGVVAGWYGAGVGVVGLLVSEDLGGGRMVISCGWRYVSKG